VTRLLTRETVMEKLVYVATNPVKDGLVDEAWQWPGTNGTGICFSARRFPRGPKHFFRDDGVMPAEVMLELVIPPELGDAEAVIEELRAGVTAVEAATRAERLATGRRVLGRKGVLQQSWRGSPKSVEPRRTLRPRFAGPTAARVGALLSYREFLSTYDVARREWRAGRTTQFPLGTYWLANFAPIVIAPLPS